MANQNIRTEDLLEEIKKLKKKVTELEIRVGDWTPHLVTNNMDHHFGKKWCSRAAKTHLNKMLNLMDKKDRE